MWYTMQFSEQSSTKMVLSSNVTSDLYLMRGAFSDPNNFVHDMAFMGVEQLSIDTKMLGLSNKDGWSAALYVNGIDEGANMLNYFSVNVTLSSLETTGAFAMTSITLLLSAMQIAFSF